MSLEASLADRPQGARRLRGDVLEVSKVSEPFTSVSAVDADLTSGCDSPHE
jgi:hypothetical protein